MVLLQLLREFEAPETMISVLLTSLSHGIKSLSTVMKSARFCTSESTYYFFLTATPLKRQFSGQYAARNESQIFILKSVLLGLAYICTSNFASH